MEDIIENEVIKAGHSHQLTVYPGTPYPLGATWDGKGVNFAGAGDQQRLKVIDTSDGSLEKTATCYMLASRFRFKAAQCRY